MAPRLLLATFALALTGVTGLPAEPVALDSQVVINRYLAAIANVEQPRTVVFSYSVSQAGFYNLEQTHRIFRSLGRQRDETLSVDGDPVKMIRIVSRSDRYAVEKLAPRAGAYAFLFLGTHRNGKHLDYVYSAAPLGATQAFNVTEITVDGLTYLPSVIRFTSTVGTVKATGAVSYAKFSKYWMPVLATVSATVRKLPTRERIVWSTYAFPAALPPSTFYQPKPLAVPTIAPL